MDTPEFELLLACCRCGYGPGAVEEVHRWSGHVDWHVFLRLARRHRVQSLVAQAFYKAGLAPPKSIASEIADDAAEIAETNLRSAAESIRLLDDFAEQSIPILFIKGLTLSALAYGDPFIKMSADIDVLVDPADVDGSARITSGDGIFSDHPPRIAFRRFIEMAPTASRIDLGPPKKRFGNRTAQSSFRTSSPHSVAWACRHRVRKCRSDRTVPCQRSGAKTCSLICVSTEQLAPGSD